MVENVTSQTADVVAILQADTNAQLVPLARPLQATVFVAAQLMEHPLENGSLIADHKVDLPIEIRMPIMIAGDFRETYARLQQVFLDGTLLTIQTRARSYSDMVLVEIPHDETAEAVDALTLSVKFRQAKFITALFAGLAPAQVKKKRNASTARRGAQQTTTAPTAQANRGSTLFRLFKRD